MVSPKEQKGEKWSREVNYQELLVGNKVDYSHSHLQYRPINMFLRDLLADLLNTFVIRSYRPVRCLLLWSDVPFNVLPNGQCTILYQV